MLEEVLGRVIALKGVTSAAVVSADGEMLGGASAAGVDPAFVGGLITSGLASSRVLAGLLGDGEVKQAMIEYDDGPVLLMPLGAEEDPVLVASLASTAALGLARFQLRKVVPELLKSL